MPKGRAKKGTRRLPILCGQSSLISSPTPHRSEAMIFNQATGFRSRKTVCLEKESPKGRELLWELWLFLIQKKLFVYNKWSISWKKTRKNCFGNKKTPSLSNSVFRYHLPKLIPPWELSHIPDSSRHFSRWWFSGVPVWWDMWSFPGGYYFMIPWPNTSKSIPKYQEKGIQQQSLI